MNKKVFTFLAFLPLFTSLVACAPQKEPTEPAHHFSETWSKDANEHWLECTDEGCNEKMYKEAHSWDFFEITKQPTCTEKGVKTYTCSYCGATKTEDIDFVNHVHSSEWSKDANKHWHTCETEGCLEKFDEADHTWDEGKVIKEPTCTEKGQKVLTCTTCGEIKLVEVDYDNTHTYSKEWSGNETQHWHYCTGCLEKTDIGEHSWDMVEVIKPATCVSKGLKVSTCSVCGKTKSEPIDFAEHKFTDWEDYDKDFHTRRCEEAGCTEVQYAEHNWDDGDVVVEPQCFQQGCILYTCLDCGATKDEIIESGNHIMGTDLYYTDDYHYTMCQTPGCDHIETEPHDKVNPVVTVQPTLNSNGVIEYNTCKCGCDPIDEIPATSLRFSDNVVADNGVYTFTAVGGNEASNGAVELNTPFAYNYFAIKHNSTFFNGWSSTTIKFGDHSLYNGAGNGDSNAEKVTLDGQVVRNASMRARDHLIEVVTTDTYAEVYIDSFIAGRVSVSSAIKMLSWESWNVKNLVVSSVVAHTYESEAALLTAHPLGEIGKQLSADYLTQYNLRCDEGIDIVDGRVDYQSKGGDESKIWYCGSEGGDRVTEFDLTVTYRNQWSYMSLCTNCWDINWDSYIVEFNPAAGDNNTGTSSVYRIEGGNTINDGDKVDYFLTPGVKHHVTIISQGWSKCLMIDGVHVWKIGDPKNCNARFGFKTWNMGSVVIENVRSTKFANGDDLSVDYGNRWATDFQYNKNINQ